MNVAFGSLASAGARWLLAAALDGTLFAALCWFVSATLFRRAGGKLLSLVWLAALVRFVLLGPFELHTVPLQAALDSVRSGAASTVSTPWLAFGYVLVVFALAARLHVRQRRLRRDIAALDAAEPEIVAAVAAAARELALARLPDVRVTPARVPPFSAGTSRPCLVLPRWLCQPGPRLHAVLLHELAHLKRRDQVVIWLERAVACVFFFWPPVHWVSRKLQEARELACDERAIERGAFSAPEYASHLLEVVAGTRARVDHHVLAIGSTAVRLERRIDRLLELERPRRVSWQQAVVLLALSAAALIGFRPALPAAPLPVFGACGGRGASLTVPAADSCSGDDCALQCQP